MLIMQKQKAADVLTYGTWMMVIWCLHFADESSQKAENPINILWCRWGVCPFVVFVRRELDV